MIVPTSQVCSVTSFIAPSDLTVPCFYDGSKVNTVFHQRQLDDCVKSDCMPHQAGIADRFIADPLAVEWVSAFVRSIYDYAQFRAAFRRNFWSTSKQSAVKCSTYRNKYHRGSNVSMSERFLKYVEPANCLEPKISDVELINEVKFRFPVPGRNGLACAQLSFVQVALELLQRREFIQARGDERRSDSTASSQTPNQAMPQCNANVGLQNSKGRRRQQNEQVRQICPGDSTQREQAM